MWRRDAESKVASMTWPTVLDGANLCRDVGCFADFAPEARAKMQSDSIQRRVREGTVWAQTFLGDITLGQLG